VVNTHIRTEHKLVLIENESSIRSTLLRSHGMQKHLSHKATRREGGYLVIIGDMINTAFNTNPFNMNPI